MELLGRANTGISSTNLIVTLRPNRLRWSNSRPLGIQGFLLQLTRHGEHVHPKEASSAWKRPDEFIGTAVNIWLEHPEADVHNCILAIGDSTSAAGWLHNSSPLNGKWAAPHEAHLAAARHVALLVLKAGCCLASQRIQQGNTSCLQEARHEQVASNAPCCL